MSVEWVERAWADGVALAFEGCAEVAIGLGGVGVEGGDCERGEELGE
jgi:hypothetical protein